MKDYVLYFQVDVKNNDMEKYFDFRRDLFECCKIPPIYEDINQKGFFNIYIPDIEKFVFKGRLKEMEKNYKEFLVIEI